MLVKLRAKYENSQYFQNQNDLPVPTEDTVSSDSEFSFYFKHFNFFQIY